VDSLDTVTLAVCAFTLADCPNDMTPENLAADHAALLRVLATLVSFLEREAGTTAKALGLGAYIDTGRENWPNAVCRALTDANRLPCASAGRNTGSTAALRTA
jgi:hypothetical protein